MNHAGGILAKNLMILASAGSGKTYQLGNRLIGLAGARGVDPERIVALTFTRKAAGEFAGEVLRKLAKCAADPAAAAVVSGQIGGGSIDFPVLLGKVVSALPKLRLGTIDSFFARVVRCFPLELGLAGGRFELIQGPRLEAALDDILADLLGSALDAGEAEAFLHAFRRATAGREMHGVAEQIRAFLGTWHGLWKGGLPPAAWGAPVFGELPAAGDWERDKRDLTARLREGCDHDGELALLDRFEAHATGSGSMGDANVMFERILGQVAGEGPVEVTYGRKTTVFSPARSAAWRNLFRLCAGCELAAAVERTAAVREVVAGYDHECARRLRARGLLGFDDVKLLMAGWSRGEEARLRREQVDFRLDARYDHWLLDEFQDTSVAEWTGLESLLDEAASDGDGSLFVVGDTKQAIYAFKGGDVRLFERVRARYGGDMTVTSMPRSFRSCPAVLELVNRVCGDRATIESLFGNEAAGRWQWEDHEAAAPELSGEARVETLSADGPDAVARTVEILRAWGVGAREMTCGVLVRTNREVMDVAERLREEGFDVIEEGNREPAADNLPGVAIHHLLRWLADPNDRFAREVVAMSPFAETLRECHGEAWQAQWEGLAARVAEHGFAAAVEELLEKPWAGWSDFNRRRAGDVIAALAEYDAEGGASAREVVRRLAGLKVAQAPGVAAVQVMTIHKAKGLGFDAVVIPEVSNDKTPSLAHFHVATGEGWALQAPAGWVRGLFPRLHEAEERWSEDQRYDAMCLLYVALTRAKRALHVLLPAPPKKTKPEDEKCSLAAWITQSAGADFQSGDSSWVGDFQERKPAAVPAAIRLGPSVPKRPRRTPSGAKKKAGAHVAVPSRGGMEFGTAVHQAFERIEWWAEENLPAGNDAVSRAVRQTLAARDVRDWFEHRPGREVFREQAVEAILGDSWLSGVVDRLVIDRDGAGTVREAAVIDFKTDAVSDANELRERYGGQMAAYREVICKAFGLERVRCVLVSTALAALVEC